MPLRKIDERVGPDGKPKKIIEKKDEKETRGEKFRKKLKEERDRRKKTDILEIGSSKPKALEVEKSLENLKEDFRPKIKKRMPERTGPIGTAENPPKRKPGEEKIMTPLARGGRAMLRGGGICKRGMNKKAVGKNS
jgi:hypothetical protein